MRVNEIFYSLQGEGYWTGTPAVFIRFSGCNLKCPFCDTNHQPYVEMTEEEIMNEVSRYPADLVVITGGEPALQLNNKMIELLHNAEKTVAVETNGTRELPKWVDWITVSPKEPYVGKAGKVILTSADEVKIVFDDKVQHEDPTYGVRADWYFVQPCDTGDKERNKAIMQQCVEFIKKNPKWRLSLQTQKILNVR